MKQRCRWANSDELMIDYHDNEYGRMIKDNDKLFELLSLEMMQTGLSWKIILNKRVAFNKHFNEFIINKVALMDETDIIRLMEVKEIVRNRQKIAAIINNAKVINDENINLYDYINSTFKLLADDYKKTAQKYKKDGFMFIGPSVIESLYQAIGLMEGHEENCFRYGKE